jgi:hypothetical protein
LRLQPAKPMFQISAWKEASLLRHRKFWSWLLYDTRVSVTTQITNSLTNWLAQQLISRLVRQLTDMIVWLTGCLINCFTSLTLSMAVQPFVGPWQFFRFLILYTVDRTPWMGDQPVARPLPTPRTTQAQNKRTQNIHALSWVRTHDISVRAGEDGSCLEPRGRCDGKLFHLLACYSNWLLGWLTLCSLYVTSTWNLPHAHVLPR